MKLNFEDYNFIGQCLENFLFGLYSGIFAMYLQHQSSQKGTNMNNILFYALCALYVLSLATVVADMTAYIYQSSDSNQADSLLRLDSIQIIVIGCCDFISQSILIYRCWIIWGCNIRFVIIPSILAFIFLATWLAVINAGYVVSNQLMAPDWAIWMSVGSLAVSITVNALVTGLIVFRIFMIYREVKFASDDQALGATSGRSKVRTVIFVLIESGMALFAIQLARMVVTILQSDAADNAFVIIAAIHQMLNGITPTIILVRVSMGLSFHDEKTLMESTVGSLCFAPNNTNSIPGTGSIERQESGDGIGARSDDIQM